MGPSLSVAHEKQQIDRWPLLHRRRQDVLYRRVGLEQLRGQRHLGHLQPGRAKAVIPPDASTPVLLVPIFLLDMRRIVHDGCPARA